MTLAQACDHSIDQLELLAEAVKAEKAERILGQLNAVFAANAACWDTSGAGSRELKKLAEALRKESQT